MGRLTVRLPRTLHKQIAALAENEGVSLNQYIVYSLTRQVTLAYTVQPVPEAAIAEQREAYTALLAGLGEATFDEIEAVLAERESIEPEIGLNPDVTARLRDCLASADVG
jgi:hypothetical protein